MIPAHICFLCGKKCTEEERRNCLELKEAMKDYPEEENDWK